MSDIRKLEPEEMDAVNGGAFKPLPPKRGYVVYQIQKGDTLSRIARAHNVSVAMVMRANSKIDDVNKIYVGDYIYIPV